MSEGWSAEQLAVRVAELEVRVAQLSNELVDVTTLMTEGDVSGAAAPAPRYDSLNDWMRDYFAPTFGRPVGGEIRWCGHWTNHAEATSRLEALWRSWEALRLDPAVGMASWHTNYLDPQLSALLGRTGPFSQCAVDRHVPQQGLDLAAGEATDPPRSCAPRRCAQNGDETESLA